MEKREYSQLKLKDIKKHHGITVYLRRANEYLGAIGYTEHGLRHVGLVTAIAKDVLETLGYSQREVELAEIAAYCHDIGNVVGRTYHGSTSALLLAPLLVELNMDPEEIAQIIGAIGNHEEEVGQPVNAICAALIIADKSDVHRSRVRNKDFATFDIHDRVNYAVTRSYLHVNAQEKTLTLELCIEQEITSVMEYFEIFLKRMLMCRRAAEFLNCSFHLDINGAMLL